MRSLSGMVIDPLGAAKAGLRLRIVPDGASSPEGAPPVFEAVTDENGAFQVQGLWPGRFQVEALRASGSPILLPQLWVPPGRMDPVIYRVVFRDGCVTGTLLDGVRGVPVGIDGEVRGWSVKLLSLATGEYVSRCKPGMGTGAFRLDCSSPGAYRVHVEGEGYLPFDSEEIVLQGVCCMDVGVLSLTPCGLLDLRVTAPSSETVRDCWIQCDGKRYRPCRILPNGNARFSGLPLGRITVTVGGEGYYEQDLDVLLLAGETQEARVMLDPRE